MTSSSAPIRVITCRRELAQRSSINSSQTINHVKTITLEQMYNELRRADCTNYPASVADQAFWFLVLTKKIYTIRPELTTDPCHIKTFPIMLNICFPAWDGSGVKFTGIRLPHISFSFLKCTRRPWREPSCENEELRADCLCLLLECRNLLSTACVVKRIAAPPNSGSRLSRVVHSHLFPCCCFP